MKELQAKLKKAGVRMTNSSATRKGIERRDATHLVDVHDKLDEVKYLLSFLGTAVAKILEGIGSEDDATGAFILIRYVEDEVCIAQAMLKQYKKAEVENGE